MVDSRDLGADPGDLELLRLAHREERVLVTIDTDFGSLVFLHEEPHSGLLRLPDIPARPRIQLMAAALENHGEELLSGAVVTAGENRVRVSRPS